MSTQASSLVRAFREASGGGALIGAGADAEQLDLLRNKATGALPADIFQQMRRGRGRPKGAPNKANAKIAKLVIHQHGDPVMFMASLYDMDLDHLTDLLKAADGGTEREEALLHLTADASKFVREAMRASQRGGEPIKGETVDKLTNLIDRLDDAARALQSKPGDLALKALALQVNAAREVAQYTHGKQPVTLNVNGKKDVVLLIPGLNAPSNIDPKRLEEEINRRGIDAIDFEKMTLLPSPDAEEGEFVPVGDGDEQG